MSDYPNIPAADLQIKDAMQALEDMPCGGVGDEGPSFSELVELETNGQVYANDATAHNAQKAWTILNAARVNLMPPIKPDTAIH